MFTRSFRAATLWGIDVRVDPSMVLIVVLIAWTFFARFVPSYGAIAAGAMALVTTSGFFVSILIHELAHGLEATHRGLRVHGITLFLFGGVTEMEAHGHRPKDEFAIAAVGPWASLVCAAIFGLLAAGTRLVPTIGAQLSDMAGLLGWLNLALAMFNVIPGAPLDGGRILRAGLWWALGNRYRAIAITARIGQGLGVGLLVLGVWVVSNTQGGLLGGVWYAVVGAFLFLAARSELLAGRVDELWSITPVHALVRADDTEIAQPTGDPGEPVGRVDRNASLHDLIDAFDDAPHVLVTSNEQPIARLTQRMAAQRLSELRRAARSRRTIRQARQNVSGADVTPAGDR